MGEKDRPNQADKAWQEFLDPDVLKPKVMLAGVYLSTFDLLQAAIEDRLKDFFTNGWTDKDGFIVDEEYTTAVLKRNRSPLHASLDWLRENGVIEDADLKTYDRIKDTRNKLAHEMFSFLAGGTLLPELLGRLGEASNLLKKIERWWIVNVEVPTNPSHDGQEIRDEDVVSMSEVLMKALMDVALGSEAESNQYIRAFRANKNV
ncbi:MAG: hypothetical protein IT462_10600 [Planctomycetes bacterium]|nr:hypothetical protein [Planctomycetota bacterium]